MDGNVPIKKEVDAAMDLPEEGELIVPDLVSRDAISSSKDPLSEKKAINFKLEPEDGGMENPYLCFECGMDCKSQGELIDHYEGAHSEDGMQNPGNSNVELESEDPLAGDEAPDSSKKATHVEGAHNGDAPYDIVLLYSCPCCGHTSSDWNDLTEHWKQHVQVTCLSCVNCIYIFSNSYHLKDVVGNQLSDKPHVCCHCPFRATEYQALKDHLLVSHHRYRVPGNSSRNHNQRDHATHEDSNCSLNTVTQKGVFQSAMETFRSSNPQTEIRELGSDHVDSGNDQRQRELNLPRDWNQLGQKVQLKPVPVPNSILGTCSYPVNVMPLASQTQLKVEVDEMFEKGSIPEMASEIREDTKPFYHSPVIEPSSISLETSPEPVARVQLTGASRKDRSRSSKARNGLRKKPCPHCSHMARDSHSLKTHILTHTKEKPFACEVCSYRATQKAHLHKHMKIHISPLFRGRTNIAPHPPR